MTTRLSVAGPGVAYDGVVRAGEAWAQAALRTCRASNHEPEPLDLSGEMKLFMIDPDQRITLRAMSRGDLELLVRWLQAPHVRRWWDVDGEPTRDRVVERYGPDIDGLTPTRLWVAEVNGRSIGFLQDYLIRDYPEFALLAPDSDAIGVDYAIGEVEWVGRGFGTRMVWAWMQRSRRRFPEARTYFAAPDHRNGASLRLLAKVGFTQGTWFDEPQRDGSVSTVVGCTLEVGRVLG